MSTKQPSIELTDAMDDLQSLQKQLAKIADQLPRVIRKIQFLEASVDRHVQELKDAKEEKEDPKG